jgi:hypothetical protein
MVGWAQRIFGSKRAADHPAVAAPVLGAGLGTTLNADPGVGDSRRWSFGGGVDDLEDSWRTRRTWPTRVVINAPRAGAWNEPS